VDSVLEGIYQREPGVIRVNVQLVDGRSGATKWAQRYDLRSSNILSFEDQIATKLWMASKCISATEQVWQAPSFARQPAEREWSKGIDGIQVI